MDEPGFDLVDVIVDLRRTLKEAQEKAASEDLKFLVEDVELEVNAVVKKGGAGRIGVKFWVLNAEGGGNVAKEATQKIRLKLKPTAKGGGSLEIADTGPMPDMP